MPFFTQDNVNIFYILDGPKQEKANAQALGKLGPQTFADDAAVLLDHLGIAAAIVLGHSMGTITASALAIQHPAKVTELILSDPASVHAAHIFTRAFYTPNTPAWMITWHTRRVLGTPPAVVAATLQGAYVTRECLGLRETSLEAFAKRKVPRPVVCTSEIAAGVDRTLPPERAD
ncbi:hypothetical protein BDW75DRAFT_235288 [Aspergillus navahoensis]